MEDQQTCEVGLKLASLKTETCNDVQLKIIGKCKTYGE
jgi:hypothetical protein